MENFGNDGAKDCGSLGLNVISLPVLNVQALEFSFKGKIGYLPVRFWILLWFKILLWDIPVQKVSLVRPIAKPVPVHSHSVSLTSLIGHSLII